MPPRRAADVARELLAERPDTTVEDLVRACLAELGLDDAETEHELSTFAELMGWGR